jgi:hypothetical protein
MSNYLQHEIDSYILALGTLAWYLNFSKIDVDIFEQFCAAFAAFAEHVGASMPSLWLTATATFASDDLQ